MTKKEELQTKLTALKGKYKNMIAGLDNLILIKEETINDTNQIIDEVSTKIVAKEKLCDEILNAHIKINAFNMKYRSLALFSSFATGALGAALIPDIMSFGKMILLIAGIYGLEALMYMVDTFKPRKLTSKFNYNSEYAELQELYDIKKWRTTNLQQIQASRDNYIAEKAEYQNDLAEIENILLEIISDKIYLVDESRAIDHRYSEIMLLIREKTEKIEK